ncbi:myb-binding protein 1A-like protein [Rhodamnia argentea]|uniref:Myb-binding protein 1A-like protein n=1 Tax=Rhodamnia argentea TaxID=178133 RepID=A0A8B8MZN5_9MYRT|nr:myb-binding protein 1A-like protein [Rhodamnia argentea]
MGTKRRSNSAEEVEIDLGEEVNGDATVTEPSKKKKKKKLKESDDSPASAAASPSSVKPMERRKKRKALDKERHRAVLDDRESKLKEVVTEKRADEEGGAVVSSSGNSLPEFHISVFGDLASADASVREAAVETLVTELRAVQKAYDRLEEKELVDVGAKLEAEKDDGLKDCAPSVKYAVRRLIRGVSSSRECARQGFSLGLTLLVSTVPTIRVESLLKLSVDLLEVSSSMKGQEVRDSLLGRLFAYGALARSGRLVKEWLSDKSTPYIREFTGLLISLSAKKRYLQEPAVSVLLDLVEKLPSEAVIGHVVGAPGIHEWFAGAAESGNPDALLLALKIRERISGNNAVYGKLLPNPFSASRFFTSEHLSHLSNCFKESTFCQPRVHSVWPVLVKILLPDPVLQDEDAAAFSGSLKKQKKGRKSGASDEDTAKNLQCFIEVVIEGSLMLSSHDRKHLAFDVLLLLFPRMPASFIPLVLSYKIVQGLMDILSTRDSWLYKVAQHFLKELSDWVRYDDVRRVAVIVALQKHSNGKFDMNTQTKTVKNLLAEFQTESGCMLFIQSLTNIFVDDGPASEEPSDQSQTTDDNSEIGSNEDKDSISAVGSMDSLKIWIVESVPGILKNLKLESEAKFRVHIEILKFLAVQGLFTASLGSEVTSFELQEKFRWPKAATSTALCRMCIEQLQLLLASAQKGDGSQTSVNAAEPSDLGSYFVRFLCTLRNIPSVSLFRTLSDDDEKAFKKLQAMETRLSREERSSGLSPDVPKLHALRYLLIQLLLQVLLRPEEFAEAASELVICCKKAFSSPDLLESSGEDEISGGDGAPELLDVLVDTLLSLLPQSSAAMRAAIEQVFKNFCSNVTDDGLRRMLRVIKKDIKPARHRNAESEDEDDEDDEDDDFLGIEEDEEVDEAKTGETAETDDSETVVGDLESGGEIPEDSEESDGGMDDDAMFRMDTYLAQIFKERKNHGGAETAHSQLVLFKLRVLSLLEIFLHENAGKPQVLMVYSNLAQAFVNLHNVEGSDQLGQRIWGILQKKIFKAKEHPKGEAIQLSSLESLLERNLKLASRPFKRKSAGNPSKKPSASWTRHKMITSLAQNSTYWILKIIDGRNFEESELQKVLDIFRGVMVGFFDSKKSQIKSEFLKEIFRRRPWIGQHLLGFILEKCSSAKSDFRRVEALDLILEILRSLVLPNADEHQQERSKKLVKNHLKKLGHLIGEMVKSMPKKQSRRAEVRKFCSRVFQIVSSLNLTKPFLKDLAPEAQAACESQLSELFANFRKIER